MNTEEREALNAAVAKLDGWKQSPLGGDRRDLRWVPPNCSPMTNMVSMSVIPPDYLGDPRLWAPLLERVIQRGWMLRLSGGSFAVADGTGAFCCGDTIAEAVCRLFSVMEGKV